MKHAQFHQICLGKMDNKYGYEFKLSIFSNNKPERNVLLGKFNLWYDSYITQGTFKAYRTEARVNLRAFEAPLINFTTLGLKYSQKKQTASLAHCFNKSLSRSPNRKRKKKKRKKKVKVKRNTSLLQGNDCHHYIWKPPKFGEVHLQ